MTIKAKVVVFLSGRGTNFNALLNYSKNKENNCPYEIVGVISDNPGAAGLYYAKESGIAVEALFRRDFQSKDAFKSALCERAESFSPDLFALAGFLQILPDAFVLRWFGKIVNIHPSLLPKFPGLDTHRRAIEDGAKEHGCTTHFVDAGIDTGPVVAQAKTEVQSSDTPEILAGRVLTFEHKLYPWTMSMIASGEITLSGRTVEYSDVARDSATKSGFYVP